MAARPTRLYLLFLITLCAGPAILHAQQLPPVATLLGQVEANQQRLDKNKEAYTFRERQVMRQLAKSGSVKKTESREYNVFFVNGHELRRLVAQDGKPLDPKAEEKETGHMKYKVAQAQQTPPGVALNQRHEVSISRLLLIQRFSNERRVLIDNRPMIALDFKGDPKAATHGIAEDATKHLSGTIWVDEQDKQVRRVQAMLDSTFRLELGLISLGEGSTFTFNQKLVNNTVWLPTSALIHVEAHALFFLGYHIEIQITDDQYRQFQATAEQQTGQQTH